MLSGFFFIEGAESDLFGDERMVTGNLHRAAVPDQIRTTVADVGDGDAIAVEERRRDGRTRAAQPTIRLDEICKLLVRGANRNGESIARLRQIRVGREWPRLF